MTTRRLEYGDERTPVVRIAIQNSDDEILAVRKIESAKWELPGGKIEDRETRFEAAYRELNEETGLEADNFSDLARVEIEDGEKGCANAYIIHSEIESREKVTLSKEHDKAKWVKPGEYKDLDFHQHSVYSIPAIENLETYLKD